MFVSGSALLLLCATVLAYANSNDTDLEGFYENGCPKDASIKKFLPHEDCRQYYKCHHGGLIARFCPGGLHFNAEEERCEWIAICHLQLLRDSESNSEVGFEQGNSNEEELDSDNPSDVYKICESPNSTGDLVAHENCNEFYKCTYGRPVVLKCARNLLFNTLTEKCDWAHNVDCGDRVGADKDSLIYETIKNAAVPHLNDEIIPSNSNPNQAYTICSHKNSDGVLIAHEYCNRFYKCIAGVPNTISCPINLLYDPVKGHCDWPRKVDCDGRVILENEENPEEQNNDDKKVETAKRSVITRWSKRAADTCAAKHSEGVAVAHERCSHFYKCLEKEPVAFSCPGNLLFNSKQNYCDWPKKVDCGDRIIIEDTGESDSSNDSNNGDLRQVLTVCANEGSDGIILAHDRCNKFYECHDGHPVEVDCAPQLLYNPETESCDWASYVTCKDRKVSKNH